MPLAMACELSRFVAEVVNVPAERLSALQGTIDEMSSQLRARVCEHDTYGLIGFVPSGSVAKRTAIRGTSDVDVAAYLRLPPEQGTSEADVLHCLRDRLREVYPEKEHDITEGNHAVRIHFHGAKVKVDVVPIISDGAAGGPGKLWDRDAGDWIETDIGAHLGAVDAWKERHPRYCELVRLTKWWRKSQPDLRFRSFLIEILWGFLLDTERVNACDLGEAMLGFFAYVARTGLGEPILLRPDASPGPTSGPMFISDPADPARNAARNVREERRDAFVRACRASLEQLAIAQTAADRASATKAYRALFGPESTDVSPRELDQGNTLGAEAVRAAARIHADLRQLRVLSGRFSPDEEEENARAVRLWIDSGYVGSVELAFCKPGTNTRLYGARYRMADGSAIPVNSGLDAPDLAHTDFTFRVNGNERWRALGSDGQAKFRETLPGSWGSAERLEGGAETGVANIGGGEPGVVRAFIRI